MRRYIVNRGALLDEDMILGFDEENEVYVVSSDDTADAVMDGQAKVQTALRLLRLAISNIDYGIEPYHDISDRLVGVEEQLSESLDAFHALLGSLGRQMPPRPIKGGLEVDPQ